MGGKIFYVEILEAITRSSINLFKQMRIMKVCRREIFSNNRWQISNFELSLRESNICQTVSEIQPTCKTYSLYSVSGAAKTCVFHARSTLCVLVCC